MRPRHLNIPQDGHAYSAEREAAVLLAEAIEDFLVYASEEDAAALHALEAALDRAEALLAASRPSGPVTA